MTGPDWPDRPGNRWIMRQRWCDLLFAHWAVDPAQVAPVIPPPLELDTRDGMAWIGLVPFRMEGIRLRGLPPVPGTSAFPEVNVRTYVRHEGRAGVWFFSLDAASPLAVRAGQWGFGLPYRDAIMACTSRDGEIDYRSVRPGTVPGQPGRLALRYGPAGPATQAPAGSLDDFLTNRLCLFAIGWGGRLLRVDIAHAPWPLRPAAARITEETLTTAAGLEVAGPPLRLAFVDRIDVLTGRPRIVARC